MIRSILAALALVVTVSAQCTEANGVNAEICTQCVMCIMGNMTDGPCAACQAACFDKGCTIPAASETDIYGVISQGLECELTALDFYGDIHCRTNALSMGYSECYTPPMTTQFVDCMATDIAAEMSDCISLDVAMVQVVQCTADLVISETAAIFDKELGEGHVACNNHWYSTQETTCNNAGLTVQDTACKTAATIADKQAGVNSYAAEFGTLIAGAQTYACANAGKTFSPTVRTKTPTLRTRSPTLKTGSPTIKTGTPTLRTKTPTLKTGSPVSTTTPTLRTRSPTLKTNSPTRSPTLKTKTPVTGSPTIKSASPTGSPTIWTRVPTIRTKVPITKTPTIKTKTPTSKTKTPTGTPVSQVPSSKTPTIRSSAPTTGIPTSASPTIDSTAPTIDTRSPTVNTRAPVSVSPVAGTSFAPTIDTKAPVTGTSFAPTIDTRAPVTLAPTRTPVSASPTGTPVSASPTGTPVTSIPSVKTKAPTLTPLTGSPTIRSRSPTTKSPTTAIPVSMSPTRSPTIKTTSPTIDTKTPTIRSSAPTSASPTRTPVTASPSVKTKAPTRSPTRTPVSVSPTIKTKTPTLKTASPTLKTSVPTLKTTSPTMKTKSPTLKTANPTLKTSSPTLKTSVPTLKTKSPTIKTKSPTTSPTTGPTVSTKSPTSSPTTTCYGKADQCKTAFLGLFDFSMTTLHTDAQVWTTLNASLCTNSSYDMMKPFYKNVMGCYLNQSACTGTDSYSLTAKTILTNADTCNTNPASTLCSTTGTTAQGACTTAKASCQVVLDARSYNDTNMAGCSLETITSATACSASVISCTTCLSKDLAGACSDCYANTHSGVNNCSTSASGCLMYLSGNVTSSAACDGLITYDPAVLTDVATSLSALTACATGADNTKCTIMQAASLLTCNLHGASCGLALGTKAAGETANTENCTDASVVNYATCEAKLGMCLDSQLGDCRLAQTLASTGLCQTNMTMCLLDRESDYCTSALKTGLATCDSQLAVCSSGVFQMGLDGPSADEQAALETCATTVPIVVELLNEDTECWHNNQLCEEYMASDYTDDSLAGTCDGITGVPASQWPTLASWTEDICAAPAGVVRTPAPTGAPVTVAKASFNAPPSDSQFAGVCASFKSTLVANKIVVRASLVTCETEENEVTRRRLLNTTVSYDVVAKVKATQADSVKSKIADIGEAVLGAELVTDLETNYPDVAESATVALEPLETDAPTKMPTPQPTPAPPTAPTAAPPTAEVVPTAAIYSASERIAPSLIAVASLAFVLAV